MAAFSHSSLQISSLPIPAKNFYKLAQGNINSRKIAQGCDQYGHWSYMKFSAAKNKIVTIITAYQSCKPTKEAGTTTYHQQLALQ
eukprot:11888532-Ditylum_brightwellii.AAC.1